MYFLGYVLLWQVAKAQARQQASCESNDACGASDVSALLQARNIHGLTAMHTDAYNQSSAWFWSDSNTCESYTGGTCVFTGCSSSRGYTKCNWGRCECEEGYCAQQDGKCIKDESEYMPPLPTNKPDLVLAQFDPDFLFGLATAAAHVEEPAPGDPWVKFAEEGHVSAYKNIPKAKERLRFLSEPEVEIDLAAETGVKLFRLGLEWSRLVPKHPAQLTDRIQNHTALQQYRQICKMIQQRGMKVMLTLFHHAIPAWSADEGGWTNAKTKQYFMSFAQAAFEALHDVVDFWVTFNEPHIFALITYCQGLWPPGPAKSGVEQALCMRGAVPGYMDYAGEFMLAMKNMEAAHNSFYMWAHSPARGKLNRKSPKVGIAHNTAHNEAQNILSAASAHVANSLFKFGFTDAVKGHLDWLGLNYYGREEVGLSASVISDDKEYSESGREIYPDGLYTVLKEYHDRYAHDKDWPSAVTGNLPPIIITENGVADDADIVRPSYIVEHLLALRQAQRDGINVVGYVHWTISDNWEWHMGYCPKFGMVAVDRSTPDFKRSVRASYKLWTSIVKAKAVTQKLRLEAWNEVRLAILQGDVRQWCLKEDGTGADEPGTRKVSNHDWRFADLSQSETGQECYYSPWRVVANSDENTRYAIAAENGSCEMVHHKSWCLGNLFELERYVFCPRQGRNRQVQKVACHGARAGCVR